MSSPPKPLQKQNTHKKMVTTVQEVTTVILAVFEGSMGFIYESGM